MWKQGSCHFPVVLFRLNHFGKLQHTIWAAQPGCIARGLASFGGCRIFSHFQLQSIDKNLSFSNVWNGGGLGLVNLFRFPGFWIG